MGNLEFEKMNFVTVKICLDDYREIWEIRKYLVYNIKKLKKWLENKYMNYEIVFATTLRGTDVIAQFQTQIPYKRKRYYLI